MIPVALTIAGSDPSGGAGIQADLRVFAAHAVHGASVLTALTVQTTRRVLATHAVPPALVAAQLEAVLGDLDVRAIKTGLLPEPRIVEVVAAVLAARRRRPPLVVDPVLVATSGDRLASPRALAALRCHLLPLATLVTPNGAEAAALLGRPVRGAAGAREAARRLVDELGVAAALVTGGNLRGEARDVLFDGRHVRELTARRQPGRHHGTGCALSAAIAANLARGLGLGVAVIAAKRSVTRAIAGAERLGRGAKVLPPRGR